jgi:hypothetical protein
MTPFRGIGANTALRDAVLLRDTLAGVVRGERDVLAALADYERFPGRRFVAVAAQSGHRYGWLIATHVKSIERRQKHRRTCLLTGPETIFTADQLRILAKVLARNLQSEPQSAFFYSVNGYVGNLFRPTNAFVADGAGVHQLLGMILHV